MFLQIIYLLKIEALHHLAVPLLVYLHRELNQYAEGASYVPDIGVFTMPKSQLMN